MDQKFTSLIIGATVSGIGANDGNLPNTIPYFIALPKQDNYVKIGKWAIVQSQSIETPSKLLEDTAAAVNLPPKLDGISEMADNPTKDEIDAKLATIEARTETLFVKLDAKIDRLADAITGERGVVQQMKEIKADNKSTRWTIAITVIGSMLAAIAALWTTQGNLLAAVQANFAAHPAAVSSASQSHS